MATVALRGLRSDGAVALTLVVICVALWAIAIAAILRMIAVVFDG